MHVIQYLKLSPREGICFSSTSTFKLVAYTDSDWASYNMVRKSTTGYCILLGHSSISWQTKKQDVTARSPYEAEYKAMAITCCEITRLLNVPKDLSMVKLESVTLYCDNQTALYIAHNPVFHECTKCIEVDCRYVRDKIKAGQISPAYVSTRDKAADFFTKTVCTEQHHSLMSN